MARIRSIKPEIWEDEKIGSCSILARLNFKGLISLADDAGIGQGSPLWLQRRLHAYSGDVTEDSMKASLAELAHVEVVFFYVVAGQKYYWLPNFLKHQRINRPSPSKFPAPPEDVVKAHRGNGEGSQNTHGALNVGGEGRGVEWSGAEAERNGTDNQKGGSAPSATAPSAAPKTKTKSEELTEDLKRRRLAALNPRPEDAGNAP